MFRMLTLCAATLSNIHLLQRLRCVQLRYVATPITREKPQVTQKKLMLLLPYISGSIQQRLFLKRDRYHKIYRIGKSKIQHILPKEKKFIHRMIKSLRSYMTCERVKLTHAKKLAMVFDNGTVQRDGSG